MKTEKEIKEKLDDLPDKGTDTTWYQGFTDALEWVLRN